MIWKHLTLWETVEIGKDRLNNPMLDNRKVLTTIARVTPWTDEQIALEGRTITKNEQRYIIPVPFSTFPKCQKAEIDGHLLDITGIIDFSPRYTVIQVRIYKE